MRTSYPAFTQSRWRQPNLLRSQPIPVLHLPKARRFCSLSGCPIPTFEHHHRQNLSSNKNFLHAGLCLWLLVLSLGSPHPSLIPAVRQLKAVLRSALAIGHPWRGLEVIPRVGGVWRCETPATAQDLSAQLLA